MQVFFVAAQGREGFLGAGRYVEKSPLPFPILLDTDRSVSRLYGVYAALTATSIHVARPSAFLIDRAGVIRFLAVGSRNRRPTAKTLLEECRRLSSSSA